MSLLILTSVSFPNRRGWMMVNVQTHCAVDISSSTWQYPCDVPTISNGVVDVDIATVPLPSSTLHRSWEKVKKRPRDTDPMASLFLLDSRKIMSMLFLVWGRRGPPPSAAARPSFTVVVVVVVVCWAQVKEKNRQQYITSSSSNLTVVKKTIMWKVILVATMGVAMMAGSLK